MILLLTLSLQGKRKVKIRRKKNICIMLKMLKLSEEKTLLKIIHLRTQLQYCSG